MIVYVGTFTKPEPGVCESGHGQGIYVFNFDPINVTLTKRFDHAFDVGTSPSWVTISNNKKWLFSNNEDQTVERGTVRVHKLLTDGGIEPGPQYHSAGKGPSHLITDSTDQHLMVTNYRSGSVVDYVVATDGGLTLNKTYQNEGASMVNPRRQECPHAHSIFMTPDEKFAFVPDLGNDRIWQFAFDIDTGLTRNPISHFVQAELGCGPRHMAVNPNGHFAYVSAELSSKLLVYQVSQHGILTELQRISTLPKGNTIHSENADIHCTPDGRFVYVSNRGHDSIAAFKILDNGATVELTDFYKCGGRTPRNFIITKEGDFMLVANQDSDNICVFRIDRQSGKLTNTDVIVNCPSPVCLQLA